MSIGKYVSRPVNVIAVQLNWKNWNDVCTILGTIINHRNPARITSHTTVSSLCGEKGPYIELTIPKQYLRQIDQASNDILVAHGDYIVKYPDDKFVVCTPAVFKKWFDTHESTRAHMLTLTPKKNRSKATMRIIQDCEIPTFEDYGRNTLVD